MRRILRKVSIMVVCCLSLVLGQVVLTKEARASYGFMDALGTLGIATGIGTVLGLSTISFYESPTSHMQNALVGAGAGMIVGLGVAAYLMASAPEDNKIDPNELLVPELKPDDSKKPLDKDPKNQNKRSMFLRRTSVPVLAYYAPPQPQRGWAVLVPVLELRF